MNAFIEGRDFLMTALSLLKRVISSASTGPASLSRCLAVVCMSKDEIILPVYRVFLLSHHDKNVFLSFHFFPDSCGS